MPDIAPASIKALVIVDDTGQRLFQLGGEDSRLKALISNPSWILNAVERRIVPVLLNDASYIALATTIQGGRLVLFFENVSETVMRFFTQVDFAFDIIEHILSDPYDAMAVIDSKAQLVFVSPIHEKFFGLRTGESFGRNVRDVIQNTRLHHVLRTGVAEVGQIQKMQGSQRRSMTRGAELGRLVVSNSLGGAIAEIHALGPASEIVSDQHASYVAFITAIKNQQKAIAKTVGDENNRIRIEQEVQGVCVGMIMTVRMTRSPGLGKTTWCKEVQEGSAISA